jgi:uncharacterized protein
VTAVGAALLAPGASATKDHSSLVALDRTLSELGLRVRRIDSARGAPAMLKRVREESASLGAGLLLGGRSFGGRMCSMAVAEGLDGAAGLLLVSYPLHPPGKAQQLRTEHFPALAVPCLFISGTRDAFGSPAELEAATAAIPGAVEHVWLDGVDHSLRGRDAAVAEAAGGWVRRVFFGAS